MATYIITNNKKTYIRENKKRMEILYLEALMLNPCHESLALCMNKSVCKSLYLWCIVT